MRHARNFNPEWGYVAPASGFMRTARVIMVAAIVGATAGAAIVFSLLDRPVAEESVAARTLVGPDASWAVTTATSVAAQQPTEPQQIKSQAEAQNFATHEVPPAPALGTATRPQQSELATMSQRPISTAAVAEAPAVKDTPSAQMLNNTVAIAADPAPVPKPQSKGPRKTSRTAPRNNAPRYDSSRYFARGYDGPRYGYGSRYGYEPRYGFAQGFAWAPYSSRNY
jgi:hypothetical protein